MVGRGFEVLLIMKAEQQFNSLALGARNAGSNPVFPAK